jgi:hypothetical protein
MGDSGMIVEQAGGLERCRIYSINLYTVIEESGYNRKEAEQKSSPSVSGTSTTTHSPFPPLFSLHPSSSTSAVPDSGPQQHTKGSFNG